MTKSLRLDAESKPGRIRSSNAPVFPVTSDFIREETAERLVMHHDAFKSTLKNHMCILQQGFLFTVHPHVCGFL